MKLATLNNRTRDGKLVVVSRDNQTYADASAVAATLQGALDNWSEAEPRLKELFDKLNRGQGASGQVDQTQLAPPLPRAYEWIDASAYINHVVLVRKARKAEPPATLRTDPLIYQGGSGQLLAPTAPIPLRDQAWGLDFEAEVAVVLGDVPMGTTKAEAARYVKLVMLANDVSLRNLIPTELAKNFGFFQSKPATAFSPFAVTPDELGDAWRDGRVHLPLVTKYKGELFGNPEAGPEMHFSFYELIEFIAKSRSYTAGTILGSGTVSNEDRARGSSCLAEKRMIEIIETGAVKTPFMAPGDRVEIEMFDRQGQSIFGRIAQDVIAVDI